MCSLYDWTGITVGGKESMVVYPWREIEITLTAERDYPNPYSEVEVWAEFSHDNGDRLRRPACHLPGGG